MTGFFTLANCAARRDRGDALELPSEVDRTSLRPGDRAHLIFEVRTVERNAVESMWVRVSERRGDWYSGVLVETPEIDPIRQQIQVGGRVVFGPENVSLISRVGGPL